MRHLHVNLVGVDDHVFSVVQERDYCLKLFQISA